MADNISKLPGIIFVPQHAQLMAERKKGMFIMPEAFKEHIGEEVYVIAEGKAYARITFRDPEKIDLKQFKAMRQRHKVTEAERKKRWPRKRILYAYKISLLESYLPPLDAKYPKGSKVFAKEVAVVAQENPVGDTVVKRQPASVEDGVPIFERDMSAEGPTHPMARRLGDYIGDVDGVTVNEVVQGTLNGDEPPPMPSRHKDVPIEKKPVNKNTMSKIDKYRARLGIGNKEVITEPEIVKKVKKQVPKKGLLDRFADKLNGG
jgi:hypothetical protein